LREDAQLRVQSLTPAAAVTEAVKNFTIDSHAFDLMAADTWDQLGASMLSLVL
jgi:hypothetical protein